MSLINDLFKNAISNAMPSVLSPGWTLIPDADVEAIKLALACLPTAKSEEPLAAPVATGVEHGTIDLPGVGTVKASFAT